MDFGTEAEGTLSSLQFLGFLVLLCDASVMVFVPSPCPCFVASSGLHSVLWSVLCFVALSSLSSIASSILWFVALSGLHSLVRSVPCFVASSSLCSVIWSS